MVFAAKQVRFAPMPTTIIDSSGHFPDMCAVRIAYVRTPVCDHSFQMMCLFIS